MQKTTNQYGVGYYQVIHFDLHGAVLSFAEFQKVQQEQGNRYLFQNRYGRSDIAAYKGDKAFLFFEETKQDKSDPVEASELPMRTLYRELFAKHELSTAISMARLQYPQTLPNHRRRAAVSQFAT